VPERSRAIAKNTYRRGVRRSGNRRRNTGQRRIPRQAPIQPGGPDH